MLPSSSQGSLKALGFCARRLSLRTADAVVRLLSVSGSLVQPVREEMRSMGKLVASLEC